MPRYDLPTGLSGAERRAVLAALERTLGRTRSRPAPWALAGRAEALRLGRLQVRRQATDPWALRANVPFAGRSIPRLVGRGDTR